MNGYKWQGSYSGFGSRFQAARTVKTLIIINVIVFLLANLFRAFPWELVFALVPGLVFSKLMVWQFFSYMFLHFDLWHLALNMLMLWFFGPAIEVAWGRKQFLFYYFFTGAGAGLCSFIFSMNSMVPVLGASGAVFGLLAAYGMMFPETIVLLFFIFPMKMKHAVIVFGLINLLGAVSSAGGGIAYTAHLGGALFGYLYLKSEFIKLKFGSFTLRHLKFWRNRPGTDRSKYRREDLNRKVDEILDKISKQGIKSITSKEREILEQKSRLEDSGH